MHHSETEKNNEKAYSQGNKNYKSLKKLSMKQMKNSLVEGLMQVRSANGIVNGTILREKALYIAVKLGIENFSASNG